MTKDTNFRYIALCGVIEKISILLKILLLSPTYQNLNLKEYRKKSSLASFLKVLIKLKVLSLFVA